MLIAPSSILVVILNVYWPRTFCMLVLILCMIWIQEFNRLRSSLRAKKEHASLLEDFREFDRTRLDMEDGGGSYEQALLKEHAAVSRSTGQVTWKKVHFCFCYFGNPVFCWMYGSLLQTDGILYVRWNHKCKWGGRLNSSTVGINIIDFFISKEISFITWIKNMNSVQ